ncbi:hypothetical protein Y032_0070g488 [Ancylostoma ceylanicum]|nr:hypothetical protein Y032_0070g488 [Ancylostoma ceylanicum]
MLVSIHKTPISSLVLLEKLDGFLESRIAAGPGRGMRRDHAPSERFEWVPQRFCGRNAIKTHVRSVYLFDKDCNSCGNLALLPFLNQDNY